MGVSLEGWFSVFAIKMSLCRLHHVGHALFNAGRHQRLQEKKTLPIWMNELI